MLAALTLALPLAGAQQPALAVPSAEQLAWQDFELGMFIHFGPNTWSGLEYDDLSVPLAALNPEHLYTNQWCAVAQAMGARYLVFTAKHAGGFCWWPTDTTDYSVRSIPWRDGQGDVLADLAASCAKYKLRLGVYLSPSDRTHGAGGGGKCDTPEAQAAYDRIYRRQLEEVLSGYGEMVEVWFDGSIVVPVGDILERHAAKAIVFQGPHANIRWVGNEDGFAPDPCWNAVRGADEDVRRGVATAAHGTPDGDRWLPVECDARLRDTWFWNPRNAESLKSVEQLLEMYEQSVGRGANLLLNHAPDPSGLIPSADARRAGQFGAEVKRRYGSGLAETAGRGPELELRLAAPQTVDAVILMEELALGERVRAWQVEGEVEGAWTPLCAGTAIGHKRIARFAPAAVSALRLRVTASAAEPRLRRFAAFHTAPAPATALPALQKIGEFGPQVFGTDWTTFDLDLTPLLPAAGEYELALQETGGEGKLVVQSLVMLFDDVERYRFIRAPGVAKNYSLKIENLGARVVARITARAPRGASGDILLRPLAAGAAPR